MDYLNLSIGTRGRMNELKRRADRLNNAQYNLRKSQGDDTPYNWRDVRYSGFHNAAETRIHLTKSKHVGQWYSHNGQQFPREKYADECDAGIRHKGWFADELENGTVRGLVVALPRGRFIPGYLFDNTGERVYFGRIYSCERDAALAADRCAERVAEIMRAEEREHNEALDMQEKEYELVLRLRECLALRNNPCFVRLRAEARVTISWLRRIREQLNYIESNNEYADMINGLFDSMER